MRLSLNPSNGIDFDFQQVKPQPLLLNRSCLGQKIDQLTPLIDKLKWTTKDKEFCAFWKFYADMSKKMNTTFLRNNKMKIPKSILKYLEQDEQHKIQDIDVRDVPTEGAERIIFEQFISCIGCAKKPATVKRPKHEQPKPAYESAPRGKAELINSLKKSRNPYEIESLKEKLKLLKQAEERKYSTLPYPERLYKQRKVYEQVPRTSTEHLERRAQAKPKRNLERHEEQRQHQTGPSLVEGYPKQRKAGSAKQMEPRQRNVAAPEESPGTVSPRPSRGDEKLEPEDTSEDSELAPPMRGARERDSVYSGYSEYSESQGSIPKPRNSRISTISTDSKSWSRRRNKYIEKRKSIERKLLLKHMNAREKYKLPTDYSAGRILSGHRRKLSERSESKNENDGKRKMKEIKEINDTKMASQLEIRKISKAEKIMEMEEARARSRPNGSDRRKSQRENLMEIVRRKNLSISEATASEEEAIRVDGNGMKMPTSTYSEGSSSRASKTRKSRKSGENYSHTSLNWKNHLSKSSVNLKKYPWKHKKGALPRIVATDSENKLTAPSDTGSQLKLSSMKRNISYVNPYGTRKADSKASPPLASQHLYTELAKPLEIFSNSPRIGPSKEEAIDGTKDQRNDFKDPPEIFQSDQPKKNIKEKSKDDSKNKLSHSNDLKSHQRITLAPQPAKDDPINGPNHKAHSTRKSVGQLRDSSDFRPSLGYWITPNAGYDLPKMITKTNQKENALTQKSSPLLLADLIKDNEYLANALNEAYSDLHLRTDTPSHCKDSIKSIPQEVQDNAEATDKVNHETNLEEDEPPATKCTPCELCAKLNPFPLSPPTPPYMQEIQRKRNIMELRSYYAQILSREHRPMRIGQDSCSVWATATKPSQWPDDPCRLAFESAGAVA